MRKDEWVSSEKLLNCFFIARRSRKQPVEFLRELRNGAVRGSNGKAFQPFGHVRHITPPNQIRPAQPRGDARRSPSAASAASAPEMKILALASEKPRMRRLTSSQRTTRIVFSCALKSSMLAAPV